MQGILYLLPNLLDEEQDAALVFPSGLKTIIQSLDGLIAESEKMGRTYLRKFITREELQSVPIQLLNEHTTENELNDLVDSLAKGKKWGLISDCGLPCIADPGAFVVYQANKKGVEIQAIPGPSSLFMALQLSGFCGQRFCFLGYLPRKEEELEKKLRSLEKTSLQEDMTQIFIEAPYRSHKMLEMVKKTLSDNTLFCIAKSLGSKKQKVVSKPISQWKKDPLVLEKEAVVFLIYNRIK